MLHFGAEHDSILTLISNRTSQMAQDVLCTVGCMSLCKCTRKHLLHVCLRLVVCESLYLNTHVAHHNVFDCVR